MRTPDPMAEATQAFSPFAFGNNNPIRFVDPTGMTGVDTVPDVNYSDGYSTQSLNNSSSVSRSDVSGVFGEPGPGPKQKGPPPQATIQTYKPDILDQWKESDNVLGQISYGMADGLFAVGQILSLRGVQNHLGGRGFDNDNDALQTTMGGLATVAGPLLGTLGAEVKAAGAIVTKAGTSNPFKGKTFSQIDEMFNSKGFTTKGADPLSGKGSYFNPNSGTRYYLDKGGMYKKGFEGPHVDIWYKGHPSFEKVKFFLDGSPKMYTPLK